MKTISEMTNEELAESIGILWNAIDDGASALNRVEDTDIVEAASFFGNFTDQLTDGAVGNLIEQLIPDRLYEADKRRAVTIAEALGKDKIQAARAWFAFMAKVSEF